MGHYSVGDARVPYRTPDDNRGAPRQLPATSQNTYQGQVAVVGRNQVLAQLRQPSLHFQYRPSSSRPYTDNDPAFSTNPQHHPDHFTFSKEDKPTGVARSQMVPDESPPPYENPELDGFADTRSDALERSHDKRLDRSHENAWDGNGQDRDADGYGPDAGYIPPGGVASTSASSTSSPPPRIIAMPSPTPGLSPTLDDEDEEESSLPYLRDDLPRSPRWANAQNLPAFPEEIRINMSLAPSARALRTRSNPVPETITEPPPSLPRRGISSPQLHKAPELDRIDELDETNPYGVSWHHRGPYELAQPRFNAPAQPVRLFLYVARRTQSFMPFNFRCIPYETVE